MSDPKFKDIGDPVTCTIEECAEVIHILCKVRRFGWFNFNPYDKNKTPNFVLVRQEVKDLKDRLEQLDIEIDKQVEYLEGRTNVT